MWPFKSVDSLKASGIFTGLTDWHSHILPGVDDGIKTMEDSLRVLQRYEELGFKKVWLTPHVMEDYPNTPEELREKFEELKSNWKGNVELALAAEHMLDNLFEERLEKNQLLPIGDEGRHVLVETSYYTPPMEMDKMLEDLRKKGFFPVLAHPERYRYMEQDDYKRYKEAGVIFQMNLVSLAGGYGETAQKKAEWLIANDMIDLLGSDLHRLEAFEQMIGKSPRKDSFMKSALRIAREGNRL